MNDGGLSRIFVISIAGSDERRAEFAANSREAAVPWEFFDACTEMAPDLHYDAARAESTFGRPLSAGEIGCYSSHYSLWRKLLSDDVSQYIVLEDDIIADWAMIARLADTDFNRRGIEYLRLYYKKPGPFTVVRNNVLTRTSHLIRLETVVDGTQGYVITKAAAETLVRFCRTIVRPIDVQLDRYWEHGIPNLCLFPFPIIEKSAASTIGNERFRAPSKQLSTRLKRKFGRTVDDLKRRAWLLSHSPDLDEERM